jgi:hypothetical protein
MTVRLTAETLTPENLTHAAVHQTGLLGLYQRHEYDALMASGLVDWGFGWLPSTLDPNTGRVKMLPLTQDAVKLLDRGRALRIQDRAKDMSLPRAIGFIKVVKRHRLGMLGDVQDALLKCWNKPGYDDAMIDLPSFGRWLKEHHGNGLRPEQRRAAFELMPKIQRVMSKDFSTKRTTA